MYMKLSKLSALQSLLTFKFVSIVFLPFISRFQGYSRVIKVIQFLPVYIIIITR